MCIELMYNRHNGKIIVMRRYERGSGSCLGSVVALPLHILPLDLEVGHPLLVDGGLLLVGDLVLVHGARVGTQSSGWTAWRTQLWS